MILQKLFRMTSSNCFVFSGTLRQWILSTDINNWDFELTKSKAAFQWRLSWIKFWKWMVNNCTCSIVNDSCKFIQSEKCWKRYCNEKCFFPGIEFIIKVSCSTLSCSVRNYILFFLSSTNPEVLYNKKLFPVQIRKSNNCAIN